MHRPAWYNRFLVVCALLLAGGVAIDAVVWGWTGIVAWILASFILVSVLSFVATRPPRGGR